MGLKAGQRLGKYRILGKIATGGFAEVYRASDTVEGVSVALKVPHEGIVSPAILAGFRNEAKLAAPLDHPNILPIKTADLVEDRFIIVTLLGQENLSQRLKRRLSPRAVIELAGQILDALAFAHQRRIVHCDLKPDNLILFPGNRLRLADFGVAKVALRTLDGSGSGTVGYMAPEQAMGRPCLQSDVFSAGLIIYEMMTRQLPKWPFDWPWPGLERASRSYHRDLIMMVRRAVHVDRHKRFSDAVEMRRAFERIQPHALKPDRSSRAKKASATTRSATTNHTTLTRKLGRVLDARHTCSACKSPVGESMMACPWCGKARKRHRSPTTGAARCPRCSRGLKLDWKYCAWCYGAAVGPQSNRASSDQRYERRCANESCPRRLLLPFSRYCPWCRRKVTHPWRIPGSRETCARCGWGVLARLWSHCPWCTHGIRERDR